MILDDLELEYHNLPLTLLPAEDYAKFCASISSLSEFISIYGYFMLDLTEVDRTKAYMELLVCALIPFPNNGEEMAEDIAVMIEDLDIWGRGV